MSLLAHSAVADPRPRWRWLSGALALFALALGGKEIAYAGWPWSPSSSRVPFANGCPFPNGHDRRQTDAAGENRGSGRRRLRAPGGNRVRRALERARRPRRLQRFGLGHGQRAGHSRIFRAAVRHRHPVAAPAADARSIARLAAGSRRCLPRRSPLRRRVCAASASSWYGSAWSGWWRFWACTPWSTRR